jgi:RND family efflux transporter MFP subunit
MSKPEYPKYLIPTQTKQSVIADADRAFEDESFSDQRIHSRSKSRWPLALGAIILIAGGGLGWYWWQTSRTHIAPNIAPKAAPAGAMKPQGFPVKLATVETETLQETSEFLSPLEAPRGVDIKPETEGRISEILVRDGEKVQQGQVLVRLNTDETEAQMMQAKAGLDRAKARLAELEAGSRPEEIAEAEARLNQAKARLANAQAGARPEEIAQAQAQVEAARADAELAKSRVSRYQQLSQQGAITQDQLEGFIREERSATARLQQAERGLEALRKGRSSDIDQLAAAVEQEQQALKQLKNGPRQEEIAQARSQVSEAAAQVRSTEVKLQDTRIVAPVTGIVGNIPVKQGDFVTKGDTLTTVTQNQTLEVQLKSIPIERGPDLRLGQRVEGTDNQGNLLGTGKISFISPQVNTNSQSILAKASFDNSEGQLRDGQYVRAKVIWNSRPGVLIPKIALVPLAGKDFVYVAQTQGQSQQGKPQLIARQKPVKLGQIQGNNVQVIEGLQPGEKIIVSGTQNLSDGAPIIPQP